MKAISEPFGMSYFFTKIKICFVTDKYRNSTIIMMHVKPKKHLGQHFLTDKKIAGRIVESLDTASGIVLEIGPGKGILTDFLIKRPEFATHVVEIDTECIDFLQTNFPELDKKIINSDFLKVDLAKHFNTKIAIIGNFPYNISSQIFFKILENKNMVTDVVCMLQKEVAQRICSPPGNRDYGILSVLLQAYFDINYLFTVKPGSFFPPPKIQSGVISLKRNTNDQLNCDENLFKRIVKTAFNQRRKTLRNSLKSICSETLTDDIFSKRPEHLNYMEFVEITNILKQLAI